MIAPSQPRMKKTRERERERACAAGAERELRLCVATQPGAGAELRFFRHPQDGEGVTIRLTAREREALAHALAAPGTHFILRDDAPDGDAAAVQRTKGGGLDG